MKTRWRRNRLFAGAGVVGFLLLGLAMGCGSGGSTLPTQTSSVVTRVTEGSYSQDALILAARESTDAWIATDIAKTRDADLTAIRTQFSTLTAIHAKADVAPHDVLISIKPDTPWRASWEAGTLTTGDTAVDSLLSTYKATGVSKILDGTNAVWFKITFDQALNTTVLAGKFKTASTAIVDATPNGISGDGDNIVFSSGVDFRKYDFSKGFGDCPSGCISRHHWIVTILATGLTSLTETGPPVPTTPQAN